MENYRVQMGTDYVRIGTLLVPASEVTKILHRYAKPLICENPIEDYPYTIGRGTTTALRLDSRYFYVFCRHQIKDCDPRKVTTFPIAAGGKQHICGGTGHFTEPDLSNDGEEFLDVFGWEIKPEAYAIPNLGSEFFPVIAGDCWPMNTTNDLIAFGVPSELQKYNPPEAKDGSPLDIEFLTVVVSGRHRRTSGNVRWFHEAEMIRTKEFPMDGMSGGPVFHIGRDTRGLFIGIAGMIMRGGAERFHFIDMNFLLQLGNT
jgi:hypothetical protein